MFADSHAHLADAQFDADRHEVLKRAREAGVSNILNICTDAKTLEVGLELPVWNAAATTPHDVEGDAFFPLIESQVSRLQAIGETGLDYYYEHSPRALQQEYLLRYASLARAHQLPLIIHCREAFSDLFALLDYERVVLHCFTGSLEEARGVWDRGWLLSLSGIVTFKRSKALRKVAAEAPLNQLLVETDAPYLAPQGRRGKRNEPAFVVEVAECLAMVRGIPVEEVARATSENLIQLLETKGER